MSKIEQRQAEIQQNREQARDAAVTGWSVPEDLPHDPLMQIAYWRRREQLTTDEVVAAIESARSSGSKWWEIGASMGRTSEAARAYYQYHRKWDD